MDINQFTLAHIGSEPPNRFGSLISWDLTDNSDVQQRIGLASKSFGSLQKEIFFNQSLKEVTRVPLSPQLLLTSYYGAAILGL